MPDKPVVLDVVPDLPLDGAFSYLLGEVNVTQVKPGIRVLIPFGSRKLTGYIVEVRSSNDSDRLDRMKSIIRTLDLEPLLTDELLAFTKQVADYYVCPWATILKAALPTFRNIKEVTYYSSTPTLQEQFPDGPIYQNAVGKTKMLMELIVAGGRINADRLLEMTGAHSAAALLKPLVLEELVIEEKELTRPLVFTTHEDAVSAQPRPTVAGPKMGKRAAELYAILLERSDPVPVSELRKWFPSIRTLIASLEAKGLVSIVKVPLRRDPIAAISARSATPHILQPEQLAAFNEINQAAEQNEYAAFLINGVTGSGKTEIYLQLIERCILRNRQAIVLVPEISMTPLMISRFKGRFPGLVAVLHSVLGAKDRDDQWRRIRSGELRIVIGPRSAVFAPCPDLGIIIVDEEHDSSYKQDNEPYYQGRDMAVLRGFLQKTVVVLGSATPSVESYRNSQIGKYRLLTLTKRVLDRPLPALRVVDMSVAWRAPRSDDQNAEVSASFSGEMLAALRDCLARDRQAIILLNRRGFSTLLCCKKCLNPIQCPHCSIALVYHIHSPMLLCHHCGYSAPKPTRCPNCDGEVIDYLGVGVQKLEMELTELLPDARIVRLDSDVVRKSGNYQKIIQDFEDRKFDILMGTQLVAKGHDFPNVAFVGVISGDSMLNLPDFRMSEREFALLTQVAGRAGRGDEPGECLVQALFPNHYSIQAVVADNPALFYEQEQEIRRRLLFPPYTCLALLKIKGAGKQSTYNAAVAMKNEFNQKTAPHFRVQGPAPAPIFKRKDRYHWQILIRSSSRPQLNALLRELKLVLQKYAKRNDAALAIDIDPYDLM